MDYWKRQARFLPLAIFLLTLVAYVSVLIPSEKSWLAGLLSYAIFPFLIINVVELIWLVIGSKKSVIWPIIGLVVGWYFIRVTFHYSSPKNKEIEGRGFELLSFNAKLFRKPHTYAKYSFDMIKWLVQDSADIKCIQEYNTNSRWAVLDVSGQISSSGYFGFTRNYPISNAENNPGLAIFSKFPIVNKGEIIFDERTINNVIFADIVIRGDTMRVYNVHLLSIRIPVDAYDSVNIFNERVTGMFKRLRNGAMIRSREIDRLVAHVKKCHYPFIICGDFNEMPYSNNYLKMRQNFDNAFEHAGEGFGFSLNSKLFFLRIDHQFYGCGIIPLKYRVDRNMDLSDHFPARGFYEIEDN